MTSKSGRSEDQWNPSDHFYSLTKPADETLNPLGTKLIYAFAQFTN